MSEINLPDFMIEFQKFFATQGVAINFVDKDGNPIDPIKLRSNKNDKPKTKS